jgi:hypothetical protein
MGRKKKKNRTQYVNVQQFNNAHTNLKKKRKNIPRVSEYQMDLVIHDVFGGSYWTPAHDDSIHKA